LSAARLMQARSGEISLLQRPVLCDTAADRVETLWRWYGD
jgi:hypothetical protein